MRMEFIMICIGSKNVNTLYSQFLRGLKLITYSEIRSPFEVVIFLNKAHVPTAVNTAASMFIRN